MTPSDRCVSCGDIDTPTAIAWNMGLCRRCAPDALKELERTFAQWRHEEDNDCATEIHVKPERIDA